MGVVRGGGAVCWIRDVVCGHYGRGPCECLRWAVGGGPTSPSRWRARSGPLGAGLSKGGGGGSRTLGAEGNTKRKPRNKHRMNFSEYDAEEARKGFLSDSQYTLQIFIRFSLSFFSSIFSVGGLKHTLAADPGSRGCDGARGLAGMGWSLTGL